MREIFSHHLMLVLILCGSLLSSISPILSSLLPPKVDTFKPRSLQKESLGFLQFVSCTEDMESWICFDRHKQKIVNDYSDTNRNRNLEYCFKSLGKRRHDTAVLSVAECIFTYSDTKTELVPKLYNKLTGFSLSLSLVILILLLVQVLGLSLFTENRLSTKPKEAANDLITFTNLKKLEMILEKERFTKKLPVVRLKDDVYDLSDKDDLKRWKSHFQKKSSLTPKDQDNSLLDNTNISSVTQPSTIELVVDRQDSNIQELDRIKDYYYKELRMNNRYKARTDVNIHDPQKPIPSILYHPQYDKNGIPLKRIFLPGRGWCSARQIEKERQELLKNINCLSKPSVPAGLPDNAKLDY